MLSFMTSFMMTTKWATDQSAIRTWACINIVIFTHNLGNWLIKNTLFQWEACLSVCVNVLCCYCCTSSHTCYISVFTEHRVYMSTHATMYKCVTVCMCLRQVIPSFLCTLYIFICVYRLLVVLPFLLLHW